MKQESDSLKKYIFGPVPSRRLGMSLGVDLIPFKTCTYNCVYCQLGATICKTLQRQSFVTIEEVLGELKDSLDSRTGNVDFITFSGSGEPTLNSDIGSMIEQVKSFAQVPVAVITNGSLLYRDDVRKDLSKADLIVPSLDAITERTFARVNRPHEGLTMELIVEGLKKLTEEFQGEIWLEIMLVRGVNDDPEELKQMAELVRGLKVDRIQLNTVARPPAERFALAVIAEEMSDIAKVFDSRAEVIVDFPPLISPRAREKGGKGHESHDKDIETAIVSLLKRRPCMVDDISNSLGVHRNEVIKYVNSLTKDGTIRRVEHDGKWYYEKA